MGERQFKLISALILVLGRIQSTFKDARLIRLLSSVTKSTFYLYAVFRPPHALPGSALVPIAEWEEERGTTAIVYDLHCLTARWTVHTHKNHQLGDLSLLIYSLILYHYSLNNHQHDKPLTIFTKLDI